MRKKRRQIVILVLGVLFLFFLSSSKNNISESLYGVINSFVCDVKRGKAAIREVVSKFQF